MSIGLRLTFNAALALVLACSRSPHDEYVDPVPAPRYTPFDLHRGHYQAGFEVSAFQPCGSSEVWWLEPGEAEPWEELERRARRVLGGSWVMDRGAAVYVEFQGDTTASGHHGHMGGYDREVTLRSLELVRKLRPSDCARTRSPDSDLSRPPQN